MGLEEMEEMLGEVMVAHLRMENPRVKLLFPLPEKPLLP